MHRFWKEIIEPCFKLADIKNIVEIGCDLGLNTTNLVDYCKKHDGFLHIIDPSPRIDVEKVFSDYKNYFEYHRALSLNILWKLTCCDAILIDGDHNWYTVYHELKMIQNSMKKFPLIILHDISWPYDRRDLYYDVSTVPSQFVNPYSKKGIDIMTNELVDNEGFNDRFNNSFYYCNQRCGVLTAIEDFISENENSFYYIDFPIFNGLGILFPKENDFKEEFYDFIKQFNFSDTVKNMMRETDKYYAKSEIRLKNQIKKNEKIENSYSNRIKDLENSLKNLEKHSSEEIENREQELRNINKKLGLKEKELNEQKEKLQEERIRRKEWEAKANYFQNEANTHVNSVRYKIGTHMIEATKSMKAFCHLPLDLYRLYSEAKKKNCHEEIFQKESNVKQDRILNNYPKSQFSREEIINKNRNLLNLYDFTDNNPLVSIIVCNFNGVVNLQRLFKSFDKSKFYNNYEIIIIDNASTDDSIKYLKNEEKNRNLIIICNEKNETFSKANNQGAAIAKGEYLLFLNNDVEVTDGWLDELLGIAIKKPNLGAIGAKLIYPDVPKDSINYGKSYLIQHSGIAFQYDEFEGDAFIKPYNRENGEQVFKNDDVEEPKIVGAVTAACLLMKKVVFKNIGGFDENYVYGYEDVDLCLKALKKGYTNYYCPTAVLFHFEFGTQSKSLKEDVRKRRSDNIRYFRRKWNDFLAEKMVEDKINRTGIFSESPLTIAFAVTEAFDDATAGDYFTALELAFSLEKRGCIIQYLSRKGPGDWYQIEKNVDILISMLDAYDLSKVKSNNPGLLTIAWARNWFDRWCNNPSIYKYTFILSSCQKGCDYISEKTGQNVILFPIATNADRFYDIKNQPDGKEKEQFECDYVFTGSYWNNSREIVDIIQPEKIPYKFRVFGLNWENVPQFAPYTGGFINYKEMPYVYKYAKIVVDDANCATKKYGAVNSRVFDAIAAGCLVLTNGQVGAEETFHGILPTYSNKKEFAKLMAFYMQNSQEREKKIEELKKFVLENHTYDIRANYLLNIVKERYKLNKEKIAILAPVPKLEEAESWGDYHYAIAIKKYLERKNFRVSIKILPEWKIESDEKYVILLRGISKYVPKMNQINIMWNISHPDDITVNEYNQYDMVYVSSNIWAMQLKDKVSVPVKALLQCTDPEIFFTEEPSEKIFQLLFVGNSRKVFRKIISDIIPTNYDLSVFGKDWEGIIDAKYIKGTNIPNKELGKVYSKCDILLNDHWDDMKEKGFLSNRLFDGLAAGAFIISDDVKGLSDELKECVVTYHDRSDLYEKVSYYMEHPVERHKIAQKGQMLVRNQHTFEKRVDEIIKFIKEKSATEMEQ